MIASADLVLRSTGERAALERPGAIAVMPSAAVHVGAGAHLLSIVPSGKSDAWSVVRLGESNPGTQMTHDVRLEVTPVNSTLDRAWHLLRAVPDRDFYVQHLLQQIGNSLATHGWADDRTSATLSVKDYRRAPKRKASKGQDVPTVKIRSRLKLGKVVSVVVKTLVLGGLAAALMYLVWLAT